MTAEELLEIILHRDDFSWVSATQSSRSLRRAAKIFAFELKGRSSSPLISYIVSHHLGP